MLTDVLGCPEKYLLLGNGLHCCPDSVHYPALLVRPEPEDGWLDVRKIRAVLLAEHELIPLEDCKRLRAKTWAN